MAERRQVLEASVDVDDATVYGPVVGINTGTITNIIQTAKAATSVRQLRAPIADFVGRAREIQSLVAMLRDPGPEEAALCVIHGMGGLGKTELALRVAHLLLDEYPDVQLFLSLGGSSLGTPRSTADTLRQAIRAFDPLVPLGDDIATLAAMYRGQLNGKRALVLLDDAADSASVQPFLPPVGCALLVTSRTHLSLGGQMESLDLDLLERADSRRLLLDIAPRLAESETVDALLDICDDLPLALRVVGATLADNDALSPERFLERLADESRRIKALKHDDLDVYAVLGVGDALLSAAAPTLAVRWRMLGVCTAPFEAATVATIWNEQDPDELDDQLAQLVRRSLLDYDAASKRFYMHDLLRDIARTRRTSHEDFLARLRHASHYLAVCRTAQQLYDAGNTDALVSLQLLDASWQHIRTAATWVATTPGPETDPLCMYEFARESLLEIRLQPHELATWCGAAAAAQQRLGKRHEQAVALLGRGEGALLAGDVQSAVEWYGQSRTISREIGDSEAEGRALHGLGEALQVLGKWSEAEALYRQALELLATTTMRNTQAWCQDALGALLSNTRSYGEALSWLQRAQTTFEQLDNYFGVCSVLEHLSYCYFQQGSYDLALGCAQQQLDRATHHGDQLRISTALYNFGTVHLRRAGFSEALDFFRQALGIATQFGFNQKSVLITQDMAGVYANLGEYALALSYLQQALDRATEAQYKQAIGFIIGNAGTLYAQQGAYELAARCNLHSLQIAIDLGDRPSILAGLGGIAAIRLREAQYDTAEQLYLRAISLGNALHMPVFLCDFLYALALLYVSQQRYDEAGTINTQALETATQAQRSDIVALAHILALRLDTVLRKATPEAAIAELEAMLETEQSNEARAAVQYQIWQLDNQHDGARQAAAVLYQRLYAQAPSVEYRDRYYSLTSEQLPEPPPLPALRSALLEAPIELQALLDRLAGAP